MSDQKRHLLLRAIAGIGSLILWLLSFKMVRSWIWKKVEQKGKAKIVDVKAKMDEEKGEKLLG